MFRQVNEVRPGRTHMVMTGKADASPTPEKPPLGQPVEGCGMVRIWPQCGPARLGGKKGGSRPFFPEIRRPAGPSQKIQKRSESLLTPEAGDDYIRPTTRAARRWRHCSSPLFLKSREPRERHSAGPEAEKPRGPRRCFCDVCSLTIEYGRKRNVGGRVLARWKGFGLTISNETLAVHVSREKLHFV